MKFKLVISGFVVLAIYGVYAVTHDSAGIRMQTSDGYALEKNDDSGGNFFSELGSDFKYMLAIGKDLITVMGGGESSYDSGLAVLVGSEEIESGNAVQKPDDGDITAYTVGSTVAEAFQQKNIRADEKIPLTKVSVVNVIDGDTFLAGIGSTQIKIRLIGVDTPESVHSDPTRNTIYGTYASDYTKGFLHENMTVYLEYDEEPADIYGRTLAYVWLSEDVSDPANMLNAILVRDGYAYDKVFKPNDKYAALFEELRTNAQSTGAGLWADEGFAALWEG